MNLSDYQRLVDESLHARIFNNDPRLDTIYVNSRFSGTLQQLAILKNWSNLTTRFSADELWIFLKYHEYRPSKLVFDRQGASASESDANDLYRQFYQRSLWFSDRYYSLVVFAIVGIVFVLLILLYATFVAPASERTYRRLNLLELLEATTRAQQWT